MNFKVAKCDIEDSSPQVILCPEDCAALGLKIGDRVKVKGKTEWVTLYGSSPSRSTPRTTRSSGSPSTCGDANELQGSQM